jgi:hypothetical protein
MRLQNHALVFGGTGRIGKALAPGSLHEDATASRPSATRKKQRPRPLGRKGSKLCPCGRWVTPTRQRRWLFSLESAPTTLTKSANCL